MLIETVISLLPDMETLRAGLRSVCNGKSSLEGVLIVNREYNHFSSGSPSEIVTCQLQDGTYLQLFLKYGCSINNARGTDFTHEGWADVPYEAIVYERVLQPLGATEPKFYGVYKEAATDRTWLILEYLADGMLLDNMASHEQLVPCWEEWQQRDNMWEHWDQWENRVMGLAAAWIGRFHAVNQPRLSTEVAQMLERYDSNNYFEYARRTLRFADHLDGSDSWLHSLCEKFPQSVGPLLTRRPTIVHGDYYAHNILISGERICPVDWEHAGIDAGEMDLACLTDGWAPETVQVCELEYQRARWPDGTPEDFQRVLAAVRLCLCFYSLGNQPDGLHEQESARYMKQLEALGQQLELI